MRDRPVEGWPVSSRRTTIRFGHCGAAGGSEGAFTGSACQSSNAVGPGFDHRCVRCGHHHRGVNDRLAGCEADERDFSVGRSKHPDVVRRVVHAYLTVGRRDGRAARYGRADAS